MAHTLGERGCWTKRKEPQRCSVLFFSGELKRNRGQMWWTNHSARDWSLDYTLCMCVGCSCVGAASDSSFTCMHACVLYFVCCTVCCVVRVDATTLNVVIGFVRDIPEAFSFPFPGAHRGGHCCEFEKRAYLCCWPSSHFSIFPFIHFASCSGVMNEQHARSFYQCRSTVSRLE